MGSLYPRTLGREKLSAFRVCKQPAKRPWPMKSLTVNCTSGCLEPLSARTSSRCCAISRKPHSIATSLRFSVVRNVVPVAEDVAQVAGDMVRVAEDMVRVAEDMVQDAMPEEEAVDERHRRERRRSFLEHEAIALRETAKAN